MVTPGFHMAITSLKILSSLAFSSGGSPHKGPVMKNFDFFFIKIDDNFAQMKLSVSVYVQGLELHDKSHVTPCTRPCCFRRLVSISVHANWGQFVRFRLVPLMVETQQEPHIYRYEGKQVSRAGTSNYIPQYLWDVITCPSPWYLPLMMTSSNGNIFRVTGPLCGEFTGPGDSPHKGQWRGALMFSFIRVWINDWVNNREAGDLRRHRGHYDVNVMSHNAPDIHVHVHSRVWYRNTPGITYTHMFAYISGYIRS